MEVDLPAAQGAVVARALDRKAEEIPSMPGEEGDHGVEARRADALVAMCSSAIAADHDPDRATVIVHAPWTPWSQGNRDARSKVGGWPTHRRSAGCSARPACRR